MRYLLSSILVVFNYLDELMERQENPKPHKEIGFKRLMVDKFIWLVANSQVLTPRCKRGVESGSGEVT